MSSQGCRTLYFCNLHSRVDESILHTILSLIASVDKVHMEQDTDCWSLADGDTCHHAYVHFHDHQNAAQAYLAIEGRPLYGRSTVVKWKEPRSQDHYSIYIPPVANTATLDNSFKEISVDVRPAWNESTGKVTGAFIASFLDREAAKSALKRFNGKVLDNSQLHCQMDALPCMDDDEVQSEIGSEDNEGNTCYEHIFSETPLHVTTVQINNLPSNATKQMVASNFQQFGHVTHIHLQRANKTTQGYGLISMDTHANAAMAIFSLQNLKLGSSTIAVQLSWYQDHPDALASRVASLSLNIPGAPQKARPEIPTLNSYGAQPMWFSSASGENVAHTVRWGDIRDHQYYHGTVANT